MVTAMVAVWQALVEQDPVAPRHAPFGHQLSSHQLCRTSVVIVALCHLGLDTPLPTLSLSLMPRIRLPRIPHFLLVVAFATGAAGLAGQAAPKQHTSRATNHALDRANLDTTCAACDDFYTFANGGRLKTGHI